MHPRMSVFVLLSLAGGPGQSWPANQEQQVPHDAGHGECDSVTAYWLPERRRRDRSLADTAVSAGLAAHPTHHDHNILAISPPFFGCFPPKIPPNFRRRFGQMLRKVCLLIPNADFSKIGITSEPRTFAIEHVREVASPIRTRCNVQPLLYSAESSSWFSRICLQ
jgi:hypothetical protein